MPQLSLNKARLHDNGDCASTLLLQDTTGHHMWHQCGMVGGRVVADKTQCLCVCLMDKASKLRRTLREKQIGGMVWTMKVWKIWSSSYG